MNKSKTLRDTEFLLYQTDEQIQIDVQTDGDTRKAAMILPEGWKRVPLHTVAEVRTGLAKGKQKFADCVELPYLRVANVQDGHFDLREVKKIQVERASVERYSMKAGDVLMTEGGDSDKLGRGAVWTAPIDPCLHQNHVFVVRPIQACWIPAIWLRYLQVDTAKRTSRVAQNEVPLWPASTHYRSGLFRSSSLPSKSNGK